MKKVRRLIVLRSNPKDAALERMLYYLSSEYTVMCLLWDRQGDYRPCSDNKNISFSLFRLRSGFHDLSTLLKLPLFQLWIFARVLFSRGEVVHAIDLDTGIPGYLAAMLSGKRFVYQCLDPYYAALPKTWPKAIGALARVLENWLITNSDLFVITDLLRLPQHEGAAPKSIVECSNVPMIDNCPSPMPSEKGARTGYIGSLSEGRGLDVLLDVLGELEHRGVKAWFGGFGPLSDQLKRQSDKYSNVTFTGFMPYRELLSLEATFDFLVILTDPADEALRWVSPNKLFESMMLGVPIIVTEGSLVAKRVREIENGIVADYGSTTSLKEAMEFLLDNPDEAVLMGEKGRSVFEDKYAPEKIKERVLDGYANLLKG